MRDAARQAAGVVTFIFVIVFNGLAGSGRLSGESIGTIANRYPTAFLPADYVFGIWGLIYLALLVFCIDQALPSRPTAPVLQRLGYLWPVNGALNVAWIAAFSFSRFVLAMAIMVGLLVNLVVIQGRIGDSADLSWRDTWVVAFPFGLYLSWVTVAVIANTFQLATVLAWGGFGIDGEVWSAIMMAAAMGVAAFMAIARGVLVFPLVVTWALVGIALRYPTTPIITVPAYTLSAAAVVIVLVALRRRRAAAPGLLTEPERLA